MVSAYFQMDFAWRHNIYPLSHILHIPCYAQPSSHLAIILAIILAINFATIFALMLAIILAFIFVIILFIIFAIISAIIFALAPGLLVYIYPLEAAIKNAPV